jgi:hypothetical protein
MIPSQSPSSGILSAGIDMIAKAQFFIQNRNNKMRIDAFDELNILPGGARRLIFLCTQFLKMKNNPIHAPDKMRRSVIMFDL